MTFGEMPPDENFSMTDEMKALVIYANLDVCGNELFFSDAMPEIEYNQGNSITVSLNGDDKEQLTTFFNGLSGGGKIVLPLAEVFWSPHYGYVIDKFGVGWQVNYSE